MKVFCSLLAGILVTAGLCAGLVFVLREEESRHKPKVEAVAVAAPVALPAKAKPKYPYPECEAVMQWFRDNAGEPDSIQIIEWNRESSRSPDFFVIVAKFRGKNPLGVPAVDVRRWGVEKGIITWSQSQANDWKSD